jgi:hypothetical protein
VNCLHVTTWSCPSVRLRLGSVGMQGELRAPGHLLLCVEGVSLRTPDGRQLFEGLSFQVRSAIRISAYLINRAQRQTCPLMM